jgi:hypothetical protein
MSVLPAARAATDGEGKAAKQLRAPTLITEQEVAFNTSAAASLPRPATPGLTWFLPCMPGPADWWRL